MAAGIIRAMSRCLGISDPTKGGERSWANMLKKIKNRIDEKWPNSSDKMGGDGRTFDELYGTLAATNNPYRNSTMHLDQKYTMEEAEEIFSAVKAFTRRVANRMDEQGLPLA